MAGIECFFSCGNRKLAWFHADYYLVQSLYSVFLYFDTNSSGISHQSIDATGWMPSALFSANVAFGNIGRKLFDREAEHVVRRRYSSVNRPTFYN